MARETIRLGNGSVVCAECGAGDCDVCHVHDMPADEDGLCEECLDQLADAELVDTETEEE